MDWRDRDHDSDDEVKAAMMTFDDRLTLINKIDHQSFVNSAQQVSQDDV